MEHPTIAIIGAGHMGSSLMGGLIRNGHPADKIWAADHDATKLEALKNQFNIHITTDNKKAVEKAKVVIFAIKPQYFADVAQELAKTIQKHRPLIISIAAGIQIKGMENWMGQDLSIVRTMPNTPALLGCGATALFANANVTKDERNLAESILRAVGITVWLEKESLLDVVTALSGSGPAYFFLMMESLQQAAEAEGLPSETARILTLQTALGAARMAIENNTPLVDLRHHVTSKGGTTEKAVSVLEEQGIRDLFRHAIHAAKERSEELAELLGEKS